MVLGPGFDRAKKTAEDFQGILRSQISKAVHTGDRPRSVKIAGQTIPIDKLFTPAQDLCSAAIAKAVNDGELPNWNDLVLGSETEVNRDVQTDDQGVRTRTDRIFVANIPFTIPRKHCDLARV